MKSKKSLFVVSGIVLLVIIVSGILIATFISKSNQESKKDTQITESTYTAYVSINPLIKLTFKVSCQNDVCSEPIITNYELSNDDAKIYEDLDIKEKTLEETIELLGNTAKENNYTFDTISVYTDWDNTSYFTDENYDWNINMEIKADEELNEIPNNFIEEDPNDPIVTREIKDVLIERRNLEDNLYAFANYDEYGPNVYLSCYYGETGCIMPSILVKVTIKGKQSIVQNIGVSSVDNPDNYITGVMDLKGYTTKGKHKVGLTFEASNPEVEILTEPSWVEIIIEPKS